VALKNRRHPNNSKPTPEAPGEGMNSNIATKEDNISDKHDIQVFAFGFLEAYNVTKDFRNSISGSIPLLVTFSTSDIPT
jgi:methyl coenzyme M reductase subunit C-like uncharacterized protein (methanogenesis marker protein 7)